ncbi:MAG: sporulation protein [Oscillospiraceae bacterium]|nr:sporulation protein [Oscillospiraceae bacterium]
MERNESLLPQKLTLDDRSRLGVSGVQDIESFDENTVVLSTCRGTLIVRGRELHLRQLSVEGGNVAVDGTVDALIFEESRKEGSFWSRLLR